MDFWAYFSKNLTTTAFNFCAFGRKTLFAGNFWENFQKNDKKCVKKIAKKDFWAYLSKNLTNPAFNFCAFGRKTHSLEILRKFSKILKRFLKKIAKNALFTLAPAGIFQGGSEVHQGRACKGVAAWEVPRGGAPRTPEKFSKNL